MLCVDSPHKVKSICKSSYWTLGEHDPPKRSGFWILPSLSHSGATRRKAHKIFRVSGFIRSEFLDRKSYTRRYACVKYCIRMTIQSICRGGDLRRHFVMFVARPRPIISSCLGEYMCVVSIILMGSRTTRWKFPIDRPWGQIFYVYIPFRECFTDEKIGKLI